MRTVSSALLPCTTSTAALAITILQMLMRCLRCAIGPHPGRRSLKPPTSSEFILEPGKLWEQPRQQLIANMRVRWRRCYS
jgi:hypothetical protein